MSEVSLLSQVAELLRSVSKDVFNGKGKLCLSTVYLQKLNNAFDEHIGPSFHITDTRANLQRDLQFLLDLVKGTVALKISPDLIENEENIEVNLRRFENIKVLDIYKVDVRKVIGIQRLRPQIQELTCSHNLEVLGDILSKCGGDLSQGNLWSELRKTNFSYNQILEIDNSLESTPWLISLDLSHNYLTTVNFINVLPNLKYLNVSFNKLDKVPKFKGQICKRLQVVILSNNFIEDLSGLLTLSTLLQVDLNHNCILDHNALLSVSHLPSLCILNVQGNPINFHPLHRQTTCHYLNKNTASLNFVLDNHPLSKIEKSYTGLYHPIAQTSLGSSNDSSVNSLENSIQDRQKKVRNVKIQEGDNVEIKKTSVVSPKVNVAHLEVKKQIEQLRQAHGDAWLYQYSGEIFQDVLGFEKSLVLSSTPNNHNLSGLYFQQGNGSVEDKTESILYGTASEGDSKENFETAENSDNFFSETALKKSTNDPVSDDDDPCDGELFYTSSAPNNKNCDLCVIVTNVHISERDSVSSKEQARWNINTVQYCQEGSVPKEIKMTFDTVRKDRKTRTYYMEDAEKFLNLVRTLKEKIPEKKIMYQCIKCNESFSRPKKSGRVDDANIVCPKCESIHIIESS